MRNIVLIEFILVVDNCASNPCQHGTCESTVDGYTCTCDKGWAGTNCDQGR